MLYTKTTSHADITRSPRNRGPHNDIPRANLLFSCIGIRNFTIVALHNDVMASIEAVICKLVRLKESLDRCECNYVLYLNTLIEIR